MKLMLVIPGINQSKVVATKVVSCVKNTVASACMHRTLLMCMFVDLVISLIMIVMVCIKSDVL